MARLIAKEYERLGREGTAGQEAEVRAVLVRTGRNAINDLAGTYREFLRYCTLGALSLEECIRPSESPPRGSPLSFSQGQAFGSVHQLLRSYVLFARVKNKLTIRVEPTGHQFRQYRLRQPQQMQTCLSNVTTIAKLPPRGARTQNDGFPFDIQLGLHDFVLTNALIKIAGIEMCWS